MLTQAQFILKHLRMWGSITQVEAAEHYGCMRLGARIYDLRKQGFDIQTKYETTKNRFGEKVSYARYTMRGSTSDEQS